MNFKIHNGDNAVDDRGMVTFVNEFKFEEVSRFYVVKNHSSNFVRAWHGHKKEKKYVYVVTGTVLIGLVKIDNWEKPSKDLEVDKFVLSDLKPRILEIPSGYANGFKTLTDETKIIFFSSSTIEESVGDDFRFPFDYWNIWEVNQR
jgi:dTDP-4-dehydrorhamnose 3,5-epimerase